MIERHCSPVLKVEPLHLECNNASASQQLEGKAIEIQQMECSGMTETEAWQEIRGSNSVMAVSKHVAKHVHRRKAAGRPWQYDSEAVSLFQSLPLTTLTHL